MKKLVFGFLILFHFLYVFSQEKIVDHNKIREDLNEMINDISSNYVYLNQKEVDLSQIKLHYENKIKEISSQEECVLFFENLLNEFYDNHLTLRTNVNSSYRLFAPVYVKLNKGKAIISNVWQTQIENLDENILAAEILLFNGKKLEQVIREFPSYCMDKANPEIREWVINKTIAGKYNEPRVVSLRLNNGNAYELDLDKLILRKEQSLLSTKLVDSIGIIRINNSLGNDDLVTEFDRVLNNMWDTKGLVIDLRNTIFGGDTYEARGIMSRFIDSMKPYQMHSYTAKSKNNPDVQRTWVEYVSPRGEQYKKPLVILVGRWTGSMGEGLAIGFEGMNRAEIVGTEMRRLAGEVYDFALKNQWFGYKLSTAKLYHVNGSPREDYIPKHYVEQTSLVKDEAMEKAIQIINEFNKKD